MSETFLLLRSSKVLLVHYIPALTLVLICSGEIEVWMAGPLLHLSTLVLSQTVMADA